MPANNRFKAVLFDLGETLIRTADAPEIHRRILETHGIKISLDEVAKAHGEVQKKFDAEEMAECGESFWVKLNTKLLDRLDIQVDKELLARKIDQLWWEYSDLQVYPDVIETLTRLRAKGLKLGIVTNGFRKDFEQILKRLELTSYFDTVVGVDACNKAKPNREVFLYAINKLGFRPEEALFIGDSITYDFEGAKRAGLKPLLISRNNEFLAGVETIRSMVEVLRQV